MFGRCSYEIHGELRCSRRGTEKCRFVRMTFDFCNFDISMYCVYLIQRKVVKVCKEINKLKLSYFEQRAV